tara:strand:+ start:587 stop:856 length:270 start_codon:yes stop_codon:yes gene_type:complete
VETNIEIGNEHYLVEDGSQLHGLIQGVNYIVSYYQELQGIKLTQDEVFNAILDVIQIEKLQRHDQDFSNVDSFVREQVFELIRRDRDNI